MKDYRQLMTEPFAFLSIESFQMKQELNEHASVVFSGLIADESLEKYLELLQNNVWFKIEVEEKEKERQTLFHGIITSYTVNLTGHDTVLTVYGMSGTCLMDLKPHLRTFQNGSEKYSELFSYLCNENKDAAFMVGRQGDGEIGNLFIQYYETDWQFMKRLASHAGAYLTSAGYIQGSRFFYGMPNLEAHSLNNQRAYSVINHLDDYMQKTEEKISIRKADAVSYVIEDREIYKIGQHIQFLDKDLCIYKIDSVYRGGECIHTYYLRTWEGLTAARILPEKMAGVSLKAEVTAVKQDVVQVKVLEDENRRSQNVRWLPYSTIYSSLDGTGWYCMPEIGDEVWLHIPSTREDDAYIISAVHKKQDQARQNPDYKSIKNKFGKEIRMTPESLILTNNNGLRVELLDNEGILIESDKAVQINADGDLTVSSQNASVTIAASEQVIIQQGGTSLIMDKDISFTGGDFRMQ